MVTSMVPYPFDASNLMEKLPRELRDEIYQLVIIAREGQVMVEQCGKKHQYVHPYEKATTKEQSDYDSRGWCDSPKWIVGYGFEKEETILTPMIDIISLTQLNRLIRDEVYSIFLHENTFVSHNLEALGAFLDFIGHLGRSMLQKVEFYWTGKGAISTLKKLAQCHNITHLYIHLHRYTPNERLGTFYLFQNKDQTVQRCLDILTKMRRLQVGKLDVDPAGKDWLEEMLPEGWKTKWVFV
ncbi:MAG: hypothetical protein M1835_001647 [Candelina submexicana]|nr:MAG: hypothetical protein M1835_001647 [Candelina submexicana]